jgi:membrane protease YdiL (CAAX protease family)
MMNTSSLAPVPLWDRRSVVFLGLLILLTLFGGVLLASIIARWPSFRLDPIELAFVALLCTTAGFQGGTFVWVHLFLRKNRLRWSETFGFNRRNCGACVGAAFVTLPIVLTGAFLLGKASTRIFIGLHNTTGWRWLNPESFDGAHYPEFLPASFLVIKGFVAILLAPAAEELVFRGILYRTLRVRLKMKGALFITGLIFAGVHFYPVGALSLFFLSGMLVIVYERTGNLLAPFLLHAFFNAMNFAIMVAQPSWARSLWQV